MKKSEIIKILNDFKNTGKVTLKDYRIFSVYVFNNSTNIGAQLSFDFGINALSINYYTAIKQDGYYRELDRIDCRLTHSQAKFVKNWLEETFFKLY